MAPLTGIDFRPPRWTWLKEQLGRVLLAALLVGGAWFLMEGFFSLRMKEKALDVKVRMAELKVEVITKAPAPRIVIPTPKFGPRVPLTRPKGGRK